MSEHGSVPFPTSVAEPEPTSQKRESEQPEASLPNRVVWRRAGAIFTSFGTLKYVWTQRLWISGEEIKFLERDEYGDVHIWMKPPFAISQKKGIAAIINTEYAGYVVVSEKAAPIYGRT